MNEVISSILSAEKSADELIGKANANARVKISEADVESEKIKSDAICLFKANKRLKLAKAEKKAQECYDDMIQNGKMQARKLCDSTQNKIDTACEYIVKEILG